MKTSGPGSNSITLDSQDLATHRGERYDTIRGQYDGEYQQYCSQQFAFGVLERDKIQRGRFP
jgi:hypothetical protein